MDESAAAVVREDDADKNYPHNDDGTCGNNYHASANDPSEGVGVFCCRDCGAAFREEAAYLEHRLLHPQPNTCLHNQSDAEKDNGTSYFCTFCSLSFVEMNELHSHLKNHHQACLKETGVVNNPGQTEQDTFVCKPFQCETCGKNYSQASALDAHRRCHEGKLIKSKNISSGNVSQTGESAVETELNENQTKDSQKHFECVYIESALKSHQQFSSNSQCGSDEVKRRPRKKRCEFYCTECDKAFRYRSGLIKHQLWHTNRFAERFTCKQCGKTFKTTSNCYRHQLIAHTEMTPAKSFLYQASQVKKKAFECKDCGLKFSRVSAFQSHQRNHVVKETVQRPRLLEPELGPQTLEKELGSQTLQTQPRASTLEIQPSDQYDSQMFAAESGLQTQQQFSSNSQCGSPEVRGKAKKKRNQFHCTECDKAFRYRSGLIKHQLWHTNRFAERFTCKECGKTFKTTSNCYRHQLMAHTEETPAKSFFYQAGQVKKKAFECKDCGLKFSRVSSFQSHQRNHVVRETVQRPRLLEPELGPQTLEKELGVQTLQTQPRASTLEIQPSDQYDSQMFAAESGLQTQQQFSSNSQCGSPEVRGRAKKKINQFHCTECDKAFRYRSGLIKHQLWHTNRFAERFTCEECGKTFATASNCYRHQHLAHTEETPAKSFLYQAGQVQKKAFECKDCGLKFSRVSSFQSHQRNHVVRETVPRARPLELDVGRLLPELELGPLPLETQLGAKTLELELGAQSLETELGAQTLETEPGAQTLELELGAQTLETELGAQTLEMEPGAQTLETKLGAQTLETKLGAQTLETKLGAQTLELELGGQTLETELGAQTLETELGAQTLETELGAQTLETKLGIQTLETEPGAQTLETKQGAQALEKELGARGLETELGAQTLEIQPSDQYDSQTFVAESGLQTHQRFSSNSQCGSEEVKQIPKKKRSEFYCNVCNKAFSHRVGLINHERWHARHLEERFSCEECGKTFVTASFCYRHQLMAHTEETPAKSFFYQVGQVQKKAFECKDCGLKFSRVSAFQSHQHNHVVKETVQRARPLESDLGPPLLETELGPLPPEPELGPLETELGPLPPEPELGPLETELGPLLPEPELGPRPLETELWAQTLETQPRALRQEIQPSDQYDSQTFAAESGQKTHQLISSSGQSGSDEVKQIPRKKRSEFHCTECNKGFRYRAGLMTHKRWHTNRFAERFTCEECGKAFTTASFCYRHQLMAHTEETPAKSFLHQVGQVQKKAFECKDCGLKFSRVSAFQSHQLQHNHVFKETVQRAQPIKLDVGPQPLEMELGAQILETQPRAPTLGTRPRDQTLEMEQGTQSQDVELVAHTHKALPHQDNISEIYWKESEHSLEEKLQSEISPAACTMDKSQTSETDEDLESYEPGDFNVQIISDSEPEEEVAPDLNPDLELLCESDQDVRDDTDYEVSPKGLVSKSDLKIIQIDFDQTNKPCAPKESGSENQTAHERFHCPDCYRWFTNPTSLRVHRTWHGVRKRRQQNQGQSVACEISNYEAQFIHTQFHSDQTLSSGLLNQAEGLVKKVFTCNECGDVFSCLSALVSHQLHHPKRKQYQCPDCMMSYLHAASLFNHMKTCSAQKRKDISVSKKEYNPKKTLLGPKIYHCEQCGKGFWSLGAFSHHKQNQMECTDLRLRKGLSSSLHSVNGHSRSVTKVTCPICGRKFRHKGTMALHMRKHENGNHKCEICSRSFRLFSSLLRHEVVHSDQLLPPPIKSFQHQVEQLKKNTYSCPDCGKLFSREKALQFHMKSHGYESRSSPSSPQSMVKVKNLQCETCFAHFNNKASLRAHRKLCKKGDIVEAELAKNEAVKMCSDSNTQEHSNQMKEQVDTKNEGDIGAQQIEMHTDGGNVENPGSTHLKYKCNACDKSFPLAGALNFHKRIHIKGNSSKLKSDIGQPLMSKTPNKDEPGKGPIHCSDCGRRFMTKSALGSHRRWHKEKKCSQSSHEEDDFESVSHKTEDGPFQCKKCEKQFFSHQVLHRHQVFNPLCQTKTEPDLNRNMETDRSEQFSHPVVHCKILEVEEQQEESLKPTPEHDVNIVGDKTSPSAVKPKPHQCPLCFVTFAKARGLHAHKWQAHPKNRKCKKKLSAKKCSNSNSQFDQVEDSDVLKSSTVGRGRKKIISNPQPEIIISCLECGEQCSSADCLLDHKDVCSPVKQESKMEVETLEAAAEDPPAVGHLSEHTVKCLFKCDKCGKAFRTEEQLGTHKNKAKSRPHCCALCCHGFWTENQLQQHLAWHDEVRCRLPNEVRFRLSTAVTSSPSKPNFPIAEKSFPLHTISQTPLYLAGCSEAEGQRHGRSEQCSNLYCCLICSKTFSHLKDLIDHNQECTSDHRGQNITTAAVSLEETDGLNLS